MPAPWTKDADPAARGRILCFPYAGGGTVEYRQWAPIARTAGIDVVPVLLPGRESRLGEAPFRVMAPLVDAMMSGLRPHLDRPYTVFGHSMGALVAFAVVRKLRKLGLPLPTRLFLSQRRAPHLPDRLSPLHPLPEPEFVRALQDRYQALPPELVARPEVLAVFLPTLRADFCLFETWVCPEEPPLDVPITVLAGDADPTVTTEELEGWGRHTTAGFDTRRFAGGHFYLRQHKEALMDVILGAMRAP
jgi:medium-chain acyl-[acyl-carrier-protein] hydrolase